MLKHLHFRIMLLLCALVAGVNSAWATDIAKWGKISITAGTSYKATDGDASNKNIASLVSDKNFTTAGTNCYYGSSSGGAEIIISNLTLTNYTSISLTFYSRASQQGNIDVSTSTDGTNYTSCGSASITKSEALKTINNIPSTAKYIKFKHDKTSGSLYFGTVTFSGTYETPTIVATPTFSPTAGTYNNNQNVTLSCATDGATIYYTTDGTTPTTSSTAYSSAITVDQTMTIKAKGFKDGLDDSSEASAVFTMKCSSPSFTPTAGAVIYNTPITLTSTDGATIYYTTDNSDPTTSSNVYDSSNKPIINATKIIKAIAVKDGWTNSDVSSAEYEVKTPDAPTFSIAAGMVTKGSSLTLSSEDGTTIRYTTDGSEPTASVGTIYSEPITINSAQTIKAVAYDGGDNTSSVVTNAYTVFVGDIVTFTAGTDLGSTTANNSPDEVNKSDVTISSTNAALKTDEYRLYSSSSTTISTESGKIKKIEFTVSSGYSLSNLSTTTGSYSAGVWTGSANSVTFSASAQVRVSLIKVYVAKTAAPAFSVDGGEYDEAKSVTISCATEGATIYYTLDGTTPTSSSTAYNGAIAITETTTLKAIAIYDEVASDVTSATYTMNRPAAPTFDVAACVFDAAFEVELNTETDGATIYYTTDGSTPTTSSSEYSTKVAISTATTTVKAIAVKNGLTSDVSSVTYTYDARTTPTFTLSSTAVDLKVNVEGSVTLTTNYDEDITVTSSDAIHMPVTYNSSTKVCTFTPTQAGNYTITFSATGSENYKDAEAVVNVSVTKKETTMALETLFEEGKDLYFASEGLIEGTVKYNGTAISPQPTITYSSSNTTVATVDEDGIITFIKAGSTTLTASYAGNNEYEACNATYDLVLIDTTPQATSVTISLNNTFFGCSAFTSYSSGAPTSYTGTQDNVEVTYGKGTGSGYYCNTSGIRLYAGSIFTIDAPSGYMITKIVLSGDSGFSTNLSADGLSGTTWIGSSSSVTIGGNTNKNNMTGVTITLAPVVTISALKLSTYASDYALDFTDVTGLEAYIALQAEADAPISLQQVNKVPAGTGLLLRAKDITAATDFTVPVATGDMDNVSANKFVRGAGGAVATDAGNGKTNYILNNKNNVLGFYKANNQNVARNRAYLQVELTGSTPARISFNFNDDTTTAISEERIVNSEKFATATVYNLKGQRVTQPVKGQLYIVNGKKTIVK